MEVAPSNQAAVQIVMNSHWQPFREPVRTTVARTGLIAVAVGGVVAWFWGGLARWPLAALLVLWFSLGGHFVELFFLNLLRPRLPNRRGVQVLARLLVWLVGGAGLALGMRMTAVAIEGGAPRWMGWWVGGLAFVGIELIAHLALLARRRPNFYDGRG
ncbi:MAG: hypothetical protein U1D55_18585 [Phycisphaerae bacterium]